MRKLKGIIVSNKAKKTVVVEVGRLQKHSKYLKYFRMSKRFKAHAETDDYKIGDEVWIEETRPLSKEKRWKVIELIRRGVVAEKEEVEETGPRSD